MVWLPLTWATQGKGKMQMVPSQCDFAMLTINANDALRVFGVKTRQSSIVSNPHRSLSMTSMQQECKVFFLVDTTREQAEALIHRYAPKAKVDNFWEKRQIGANILTFAIATLPMEASARMVDDANVIRVEVITTFSAQKDCPDCKCH